jgi:serine/threonine-protein kinase
VLSQPFKPLSPELRCVSPELDAVLARCLEKEPENRYATVADLARALESCRGKSPAGIGRDEMPTLVELEPTARRNVSDAAISWSSDGPTATGSKKRSSRAFVAFVAFVAFAVAMLTTAVIVTRVTGLVPVPARARAAVVARPPAPVPPPVSSQEPAVVTTPDGTPAPAVMQTETKPTSSSERAVTRKPVRFAPRASGSRR